jgi:predicted ATP-binding protein involved in virulence
MYISRFFLRNYRGAAALDLNLHDKLNVFVGMNGVGKSTILDASAIMLSWLANRIKTGNTTSGRPIAEVDIQNGKSSASLELHCKNGDGTTYTWKLVKSRKGYSKQEDRTELQRLNDLAKVSQFQEGQREFNLPLFVYYPINRAVLDIPLRIRERHRFDLFAAYEGALSGGTNFRTFFEWFREREDLENENRKYLNQENKPQNFQFPDPQLESVRKALLCFMPEFANLQVRRSPLRMEVDKNGKRLTIQQLSDGEKCWMAMMGDLARRLAIANPSRTNPLEGEGIVLIDEIDLHLHPQWQRIVVPKLLNIFTNCQFLISTHSPHVITHVQPGNLHLLSLEDMNMTVRHPTESYGKNVDRILEDLMGFDSTRPEEIASELLMLYSQIERGETERALNTIGDLKVRIGEDPELAKASVLIRRRELIGK